MHLPTPAACSLQMVDDVVHERQGGPNGAYFAGLGVEWRARVQAYIDATGSPSLVPTWPAIETRKKSFLNLYVAPAKGSVQGAMLAALRAHGLSICPACGEPGAPNTLDHYLPKTTFPHFCVTPHNLFPMCDACQTKKGDRIGNAQGERFFLHPYFDVFVGDQVLNLEVSPPFDKPTFDLAAAATLTPVRRALVSRHVRELGIVARYAHYFLLQHRRLLRLVAGMRASHQNIAVTLASFRDAHAEPSKNGWDHIFYAAVLKNAPFMTYLEQGALPNYL